MVIYNMSTKNKRAAASKQTARQVHLGVHVFKLPQRDLIAHVKSVTMKGARWHVENPLLLELKRSTVKIDPFSVGGRAACIMMKRPC